MEGCEPRSNAVPSLDGHDDSSLLSCSENQYSPRLVKVFLDLGGRSPAIAMAQSKTAATGPQRQEQLAHDPEKWEPVLGKNHGQPKNLGSATRRGLLPSRNRRVIPLRRTGVKLARAADLLVRVLDHFLPLRDPADRTRHREQHGEHRGGKAHRLERDARIEVDVRVKLLLDEIFVAERDLFQL